MNIVVQGKDIVIKNVTEFNCACIFENGQAFRYEKMQDHYLLCLKDICVCIYHQGDDILIQNGASYPISFWENYFDLTFPYEAVRKMYEQMDEHLKSACEFGKGLRILNQDLLEMIITFIISANNHIPRIQKCIETICALKGSYLGEYGGKKRYGFPSLKALASISEEQFKNEVKVGYRSRYLVDTIAMLQDETLWNCIAYGDYESSLKALLTLPGVGRKVADCILLFARNFKQAFPVDTWVKRVMFHYYGIEKANDILPFAQSYFKNYGGLAQQYLFYKEREKR